MSAAKTGAAPAAALLALGIVFGDIGTSPLYAFEAAVQAAGGPSRDAILGVVSLILWAIFLSVAVKYVALILRADNEGEGGVFALAALLGLTDRGRRSAGALLVVAMLGAAALFGDAVITPAISILSAVEGVRLALPALDGATVPIATAILAVLFLLQSRGAERLGLLFGPVMLAWFVALLVLGLRGIALDPSILGAVDPRAALALIGSSPGVALAVLAAAFLAVTGGEALYADLGQVGRPGIRLAWWGLVLPALIANYLGQGALLLTDPSSAKISFFGLAPDWARLPLLALATLATVIASQAVLTGLFSLAHQGMQLGLLPPMRIVHTSARSAHQLVLPSLNALLAAATIGAAIAFGSSEALADAYGLSVVVAMSTTTILYAALMLRRHGASAWPLAVGLLMLDGVFLAANASKIATGGAFPIVLAAVALAAMLAWTLGQGRARRAASMRAPRRIGPRGGVPLHRPIVFLARPGVPEPGAMTELACLLDADFPASAIVTVTAQDRPHVPPQERVTAVRQESGSTRIELRTGYMQRLCVPETLSKTLRALGMDPSEVIYVATLDRIRAPLRLRGPTDALMLLYGILTRFAERAPDRYGLPAGRTIEIGVPLDPGRLGPRGPRADLEGR